MIFVKLFDLCHFCICVIIGDGCGGGSDGGGGCGGGGMLVLLAVVVV